MKDWWKYAITIVATLVVCAIVGYFINRSATEKLRSDLAGLRADLVMAQQRGDDFATRLRLVQGQLDAANSLVASQQSELAGDKRTLANQQSIIDAQRRGLDKIAQDLAASGGDFSKRLKAFTEGFRRLYAIYHPGGK